MISPSLPPSSGAFCSNISLRNHPAFCDIFFSWSVLGLLDFKEKLSKVAKRIWTSLLTVLHLIWGYTSHQEHAVLIGTLHPESCKNN